MDDLSQIPNEPEMRRSKKPILIAVFLILALIATGAYFLITERRPSEKKERTVSKRKIISEKIIFSIPEEHGIVTIDKMFVSENGEHWAYVAKNALNGKEFAVIDGKGQKEYDAVKQLLFGKDGKNYAYVAETKHKDGAMKIAVFNGKESKSKYAEIRELIFSPNKNDFAFRAAKQNGKWTVVFNEQEGKEYGGISGLVFGPDSRHFAYRAVLNEEQIGNVITGRKEAAVADGNEGPKYDSVDEIKYTADGKLAYRASELGKSFAVIDGKQGKLYDEVSLITANADGGKIAYAAGYSGKKRIVINGTEQNRAYDLISEIVFSHNGDKTAVIAGVFENDRKRSYSVFVNGVEDAAKYESISSLVFSSDGKNYGYAAVKNKQVFAIRNGKENKEIYDAEVNGIGREPGIRGFVFGSDSNNYAYIAAKGGTWLTVLNDKAGNPFDYIWSPLKFSEDSKSVSFFAVKERSVVYVTEE